MAADGLKGTIEAAPAPAAAEAPGLDLEPTSPFEQAKGAGRPKGARNKRTVFWQRWIDQSGQHPIEFLASVFRGRVDEVAAKHGLTRSEALNAMIRAAEAVLPYVEQKLPIAVEDVGDGKRPVIIVGELSGRQQAQVEGKFGLTLRPLNGTGRAEQNQQVIDLEPEKSDGAKSDGEPK